MWLTFSIKALYSRDFARCKWIVANRTAHFPRSKGKNHGIKLFEQLSTISLPMLLIFLTSYVPDHGANIMKRTFGINMLRTTPLSANNNSVALFLLWKHAMWSWSKPINVEFDRVDRLYHFLQLDQTRVQLVIMLRRSWKRVPSPNSTKKWYSCTNNHWSNTYMRL